MKKLAYLKQPYNAILTILYIRSWYIRIKKAMMLYRHHLMSTASMIGKVYLKSETAKLMKEVGSI